MTLSNTETHGGTTTGYLHLVAVSNELGDLANGNSLSLYSTDRLVSACSYLFHHLVSVPFRLFVFVCCTSKQ